MIRSFHDRLTARVWAGERVREYQAFLPQAQRRLRVLNDADTLADLRALPSNCFEALKGDRVGFFSIRINSQWRICFRWDATEPAEGRDPLMVKGDATHVGIIDYH